MSKAKTKLKGVNLDVSRVIDSEEGCSLPPSGWHKVNADGAVSISEKGRCGGVIRNEVGDFCEGFFIPLAEIDIL